jgi:hypothetical protein
MMGLVEQTRAAPAPRQFDYSVLDRKVANEAKQVVGGTGEE